jgi:hypothetical protein
MSDPYASHSRGLESPAIRHFAITPSDTVDLAIRPRVIKVLTAGNVALRDAGGTSITYAVLAGDVLQFSAMRIMATGTTASVVGWY